MAASAGAAVDGDRDLPLPEAEGLGGGLVEDVLDHIQLEEVVARSEGPQLGEPPLAGLVADLGGIGIGHVAVLLGRIEVLLPAVAVLHGPFGAVHEDVLQLLVSDLREALGAESRRDVPVELVHEVVLPVADVLEGEVGLDETDSAVDIESYASGGDRSRVGVHGGDPSDGESVSPVDVRHGHRAPDDPGEAGDVGGLLGGVVGTDAGDHRLVGVDYRVGPHADGFVHGDLPPVVVESVQLPLVCHVMIPC